MFDLSERSLLESRSYIDGLWVTNEGGKTFPVINPATGETIADMADLGAAETRCAIECAHQAQKPWAARTAKERSVILRRWYDLIMAHQEDLARIITAEMGKPLAEAASSNGSPRRPSASTATPSPAIRPTSASWSSSSPSASSARSRRGTSRTR
jgi:succinate-semialdehyde dehydrogenase/glutarate-semialdehyde dehydrogenase